MVEKKLTFWMNCKISLALLFPSSVLESKSTLCIILNLPTTITKRKKEKCKTSNKCDEKRTYKGGYGQIFLRK